MSDLIQTRVATNVRLARANAGLSQRQLADKLGHSEKLAISRWENAHVLPSTANVIALAEALGIDDPAWFYCDHSAEAAAAA
jgi:transcriptional regulator with XRE-family HTH domain